MNPMYMKDTQSTLNENDSKARIKTKAHIKIAIQFVSRNVQVEEQIRAHVDEISTI